MSEMTRVEKAANLGAVAVPFLATLIAIALLWNSLVSATDLAIAVAMYLVTALGITVGFHRLLTHRSFQTSKPVEYALAILGSMAVQGPVISWVADHRKHHAHTDVEGDPHSPHVGHDGGPRGVLAGLWHAHSGWLMSTQGRADWKRYAAELYEDPKMRTIGRRFPLIALASLLIPTMLGFVLDGFTARGALLGFIWGGLVRIFFVCVMMPPAVTLNEPEPMTVFATLSCSVPLTAMSVVLVTAAKIVLIGKLAVALTAKLVPVMPAQFNLEPVVWSAAL